MAHYVLNNAAVEHGRGLIAARQYVLDSDWGDVQPRAADENAFLESHPLADDIRHLPPILTLPRVPSRITSTTNFSSAEAFHCTVRLLSQSL